MLEMFNRTSRDQWLNYMPKIRKTWVENSSVCYVKHIQMQYELSPEAAFVSQSPFSWKGPCEASSPISHSKQDLGWNHSILHRTLTSLVMETSKGGFSGQFVPVLSYIHRELFSLLHSQTSFFPLCYDGSQKLLLQLVAMISNSSVVNSSPQWGVQLHFLSNLFSGIGREIEPWLQSQRPGIPCQCHGAVSWAC